MNNLFVPSGEASAILSQLTSSRLDLKRTEGLNGIPDRYFEAYRISRYLGLLDHPQVAEFLDILASQGVAMAMSGASSLDRMASVLPNADNVLVTQPQGRSVSLSGASPQGYTRPNQEGEGKHLHNEGGEGVREDLSPSPDTPDLSKSDTTDRSLAYRPFDKK